MKDDSLIKNSKKMRRKSTGREAYKTEVKVVHGQRVAVKVYAPEKSPEPVMEVGGRR